MPVSESLQICELEKVKLIGKQLHPLSFLCFRSGDALTISLQSKPPHTIFNCFPRRCYSIWEAHGWCVTHVWGSPDRGPAKNLDQVIFKETRRSDFTPDTSTPPHCWRSTGSTDTLTDPQQAPAWEKFGRDSVKVERRNVYNTRIPSGWKGLKRAENGQVVMGGNRSAGDPENKAKKHIPLRRYHDAGYCTDQCWHLFLLPFPGICLERSSPKILEV